MIYREEWVFRQSWLDYVKSTWRGIGRVELVSDDSRERLEFMEAAKQSFTNLGFPINYVKTYLSVQQPEKGHGYAEQYPHTHEPKDGMTLVHYLQPGDKPAPLDIFNKGEVIETIYPKAGLTVFMPNDLMHGVRKNKGHENRIQLIATALRCKRGSN